MNKFMYLRSLIIDNKFYLMFLQYCSILQKKTIILYFCKQLKSYIVISICKVFIAKIHIQLFFKKNSNPESISCFHIRDHQKILVMLCHSFEASWTTSSKFKARLMSSPSCPWWLVDSWTVPKGQQKKYKEIENKT